MSDAPVPAAPVTELKATAHLMRLEPGLFCLFNPPGGPAADPRTGLPGIRISAAPAPGPFTGAVTLSSLAGDGWIAGGDGAALVRVTGGPAQVLVTVYQAANGGSEAPRLQVLRLTEPAGAAAQARGPAEVAGHVYGLGDVTGPLGDWIGERGSKRWIEGFGIQPTGDVPAADVEYQAVLGRGWLSPWTEGGQFCGSRGMSLPILGLRVRLRGASAETHTVSLSATFVDGAEIGPVGDGEPCEAPSLAPLEAFQVSFVPRRVEKADDGPAPKRKGTRRR